MESSRVKNQVRSSFSILLKPATAGLTLEGRVKCYGAHANHHVPNKPHDKNSRVWVGEAVADTLAAKP